MAAILSDAVLSAPIPTSRSARAGWRNSFRVKLYGLVAIATVLLLGFFAYTQYNNQKAIMASAEDAIGTVLDSAFGVLDFYAKQVETKALDRPTAEKLAFQALNAMRYGPDKDYVFAWRLADTITVFHGNPEIVGKSIYNFVQRNGKSVEEMGKGRIAQVRAAGGRTTWQSTQKRPGSEVPAAKLSMNAIYEPWGLMVGAGAWLDTVEAELHAELMKGVIVSLLIMAVLLVSGMLIVRSVMRQLGGEPASAVQVMRGAASGDFRGGASAKSIPGSLLAAFGDMSGSIRNMIVNVRDEASSLKRDAGRLSDSVQQVSVAAGQQSEATASMAAAIEELTVSVSHISEAALETEQLSEGVASLCRSSEGQVGSASDGMQRIASAVGEASVKIAGLEARAEQINVIAASIKEIASQTNLLALNAAIEAARAGEQGRGFSVVADEVRKLAERTASATIEIEQMVKVVQAETKDSTITMSRVRPIVEEGTSLTNQVAESLREIRSRADMTLERVREVANATREQSSASTAIAQRVESIAQMVEETNASMEETARSASDMRDMSIRLDHLVGSYKV
jgi:methyl-accepting chemotaxis protein